MAAAHVAITGASGLIGTMLTRALRGVGHRVTALVRHPPRAEEIRWDPDGTGVEPSSLRGIDAVVHLAGENIARRWTGARKRRILESRRLGTRLLSEAIARAPEGPRLLISASAIGYYGDRGEEELTEASAPGSGFLAEVTRAWEEATGAAEAAGIRVVRIRIGLLLTPRGGLLQRLLPPFRLGLGGPLGSGRQWMSWIAADDLIGVVTHALDSQMVTGPVNAVAPEPVRNREFARTLGKVLHRPAVIPVPAIALRLAFGEMAEGAILSGARVRPAVLQRTGFAFRHPALEPALQHLLNEAPRA